MRIGLVAPPWVAVPPPGYGGTEMVVDLLARGLQDAGHEVLLAASADSTCPVPRVPGAPDSDPGSTNDATSLIAHVVIAYAALGDVDVIHDHTVAGPVYAGRPAGIPVAVTQHNAFTTDALTLFRAAAANTAVVAISHDHAAHAEGVPIARVIHHGLDPSRVPAGVTGFLGELADLVDLLPRVGELSRAACREDVEQRFSAERMVRDHLRLYHDLVGR